MRLFYFYQPTASRGDNYALPDVINWKWSDIEWSDIVRDPLKGLSNTEKQANQGAQKGKLSEF